MSLFTYTEAEFMDWLKQNRRHFQEGYGRPYTPDEVVNVACAAGFDREMVYRVLSHFERAMEGRNIDRDADLHTHLIELAIQDATKMEEDLKKPAPFDTSSHWKNLVDHNVTGEDVA